MGREKEGGGGGEREKRREGGKEEEKEGGRDKDWKSRNQATMLPVTVTFLNLCFLVRDTMLLKTCYTFFIVSLISTCFLSHLLFLLHMLASISSARY